MHNSCVNYVINCNTFLVKLYTGVDHVDEHTPSLKDDFWYTAKDIAELPVYENPDKSLQTYMYGVRNWLSWGTGYRGLTIMSVVKVKNYEQTSQ